MATKNLLSFKKKKPGSHEPIDSGGTPLLRRNIPSEGKTSVPVTQEQNIDERSRELSALERLRQMRSQQHTEIRANFFDFYTDRKEEVKQSDPEFKGDDELNDEERKTHIVEQITSTIRFEDESDKERFIETYLKKKEEKKWIVSDPQESYDYLKVTPALLKANIAVCKFDEKNSDSDRYAHDPEVVYNNNIAYILDLFINSNTDRESIRVSQSTYTCNSGGLSLFERDSNENSLFMEEMKLLLGEKDFTSPRISKTSTMSFIVQIMRYLCLRGACKAKKVPTQELNAKLNAIFPGDENGRIRHNFLVFLKVYERTCTQKCMIETNRRLKYWSTKTITNASRQVLKDYIFENISEANKLLVTAKQVPLKITHPREVFDMYSKEESDVILPAINDLMSMHNYSLNKINQCFVNADYAGCVRMRDRYTNDFNKCFSKGLIQLSRRRLSAYRVAKKEMKLKTSTLTDVLDFMKVKRTLSHELFSVRAIEIFLEYDLRGKDNAAVCNIVTAQHIDVRGMKRW